MSPAERAWLRAMRPAAVLRAVEERLIEGGAVIELRQFQGLSAQEMDVLIYREIHA